ncbi:MAG TPA: hypothetical protein DHV28_12900 [Ignavibacteriales bacterium]|nr:hypothetical protein [Ignavibacteriales bacterium]
MLFKNFLFSLIFLFVLTNCFAQEPVGWFKLISPTSETLRRLYFVDANNGWAVSLGGKIINTTDSGNNWNIQNSTVTTPIVDIFFINPNRGWALTYPSEPPFGTSILKTTDGGESWVKDSVFFQNEIFSTIFFVDDNVGFIGGNGIKKTTDGGLSWTNAFIEPGGVSTLPINKFSFYSKTFGYACGGRVDIAGVIWRTTDGGNNWTSIGLSPDQIYDVFIFDSLNAISLSGDPEMLYPVGLIKTTDAGVSWEFNDIPIFGISYAIDFLDQNEGWSAAGYKFLNSTDGGKTWVEQFIFDSTIVYDLQFVDKYTGYACGQDGVLLKFTSYKKFASDNTEIYLSQNYPNPFSDKTSFVFTVNTPEREIPARVIIKLYDILGNEVTTIVDDFFAGGFYYREIDPQKIKNSIASGIYVLTATTANTLVSKKIVYIKRSRDEK